MMHRWQWWPFLVGGVVFLLVAMATGWPPPIIATDIDQHRSNTALPSLRGEQTLEQTFRPGWDGLTEISFMLVKYGDSEDTSGNLFVRLADEQGTIVAEQAFSGANWSHNDTLTFRFPPLNDSAGQTYTLILQGGGENNMTGWGYTLDAYSGGELTMGGEATPAGDLSFTTRYQLSWITALKTLGQMLGEHGALLLLALAYLFLPGAVLVSVLRVAWCVRPNRVTQYASRLTFLVPDPAGRVGLTLTLSLALWPLIWFWMTLVGLRWASWSLWLVVIGGWLLVAGCWLLAVGCWPLAAGARLVDTTHHAPRTTHHALSTTHYLLIAILILGFAVRLLAVRDLAYPAWVDAGRHGLIAQIMADTGQVIQSYEPLLPIDEFPYHFGYHTLPAGLLMMGNWPLEDVLLILGQLLNALVPLAVYAGGWLVTRRRNVGLLSAFLVAIPFFFPAYYATWGRFTQLTGMILLPVLLAVTWLLVRGGKGWRRAWWVVALLSAGLFLVHFRVFMIYVPFVALLWFISNGRHTRWIATATTIATLLILPRLADLLRVANVSGELTASSAGYNAFPTNYVTTGWELPFLYVAGLGLLFVTGASFQGKAWAMWPLLLAGWMGFVLVFLSGRVAFIPTTWLINLNSAYITLFVSQAFVIGVAAMRVHDWVRRAPWLGQMGVYALAGASLMALLLFGVRQQITILHPVTILARPGDEPALEWINENLPDDAHIAVSSWKWLGNTWAGSDGGMWLVQKTGRSSTTPPADYIYSLPITNQVSAFNEQAEQIEDWSDPANAEWLREQGVTHVFVGVRGGYFDPAGLADNPELTLLYGQNGAFIFQVNSP